MVKVELIYDSDCPNVEQARAQLKEAFIRADIEAEWREWNRADDRSPDYVGGYGSPSILVNGKDVSGLAAATNGDSCRLYPDERGQFNPVPSVEAISSALVGAREEASRPGGEDVVRRYGWKRLSAIVPGAFAVMIPGISCPACWPAYTGLLSSLGIGFFNYTPWLLPLTTLFLVIAVGALGFRAKRRRGYGPFYVGLTAVTLVICGRFAVGWGLLTFSGIVLLIGASVWNSWPRKTRSGACGSACVPAGSIADYRRTQDKLRGHKDDCQA